MKKNFFYAMLAVVLASCNANNPEQQKLSGTWAEQTGSTTIKTFVFKDDNTLIYTDKPDTTAIPVIDWGGDYAELKYKATETTLTVSGTRKENADNVPFEFSTTYSIHGDTLSLTNFSHNGINVYSVRPLIRQ